MLFFLFSMKFWYCDSTFQRFMQMLQFLLNGHRLQYAEPRSCTLEDRLQKAAKRGTEKMGQPIPKKLKNQGERR